MRKTSVYLEDDEAEGLHRLATATGRPQAELIREGVRHVIAAGAAERRRFRSLGRGRGGGGPAGSWSADDLHKRKVSGRR